MNAKQSTKNIKLIALFILLYTSGFAQKPFSPNSQGYISDPAFHKMIRQKGYQLVSAFKPVSFDDPKMIAKVMVNNQWQYIDTYGKTIDIPSPVPVPVTEAGGFGTADITISSDAQEDGLIGRRDLHIIDINGLKGVLDKKTDEMVVPATYESIYFMNGIIRLKKNDKYGFATQDGKIVAPPVYDDIAYFHQNKPGKETLFLIKDNEKYGLITRGGKILIKPAYDQIDDCPGCASKLIKVKGPKWGLATPEGKVVSKLAYEYILNFNSKGLLTVTSRNNNRLLYGIIDTLGREVLEPVYTRVQYLAKQNLIQLTSGTQDKPQFGIANTQGQILLEPKYIHISDFRSKKAIVRLDNKFGLINDLGKMVISPLYNHLLFSEDHTNFIVGNDERYGVVNENNKIILPIEFKQIYFLSDGRFLCQLNAKWTIVNALGKTESALDYPYIWATNRGFIVSFNGKSGAMDYTGKIIIPLKYDKIFDTDFLNIGFVNFQLDGRRGQADMYGNELFN